jgi:hypothetical protein
MKFKSCIVFFAVLFFLIFPVTIFAQQSNFYGKWTSKANIDNHTIAIVMEISESNITMSIELFDDDSFHDLESIDVEIIRWSRLTNTDNATRANYPNGFSVITDFYGEELPFSLFISNDRRQLILQELNDEEEGMFVFVKQ